MQYNELNVRVERRDDGTYAVLAWGETGEANGTLQLPFNELELENFVLRIGRTRRGTRRLESPEMQRAREFGGRLFDALFSSQVRDLYRDCYANARADGKGLRLKLSLGRAPELADVPWEYLYDEPAFLSISRFTPVVRYLDLPRARSPLSVELPLRVLAMISAPVGAVELDVEAERRKVEQALQERLIDRDLVEVTWLEQATLRALQRELRRGPYHVFHFIGHGAYNPELGESVLLLEDEDGRGRPVSGTQLGTMLADHTSLRLAVLNACEGARTSRDDPFSGVAAALVQRELPAVIAMQFEITDRAAIIFAEELYAALVEGLPVDAALAETRKAIYGDGNDVEWGTPVLFMRVRDGRVFELPPLPDEVPGATDEAERLAREQAESEQAERLAREEAEREEAARLAREQAEAERLAEEAERERVAQAAAAQAAAERLAREEAEQEEAARLARDKAAAERLAREEADREEKARVARERSEAELARMQREEAEPARLIVSGAPVSEALDTEQEPAKPDQVYLSGWVRGRRTQLRNGLALLGATAIVIGYFVPAGSSESYWSYALLTLDPYYESNAWYLWSPIEALGIALLAVVVAFGGARIGLQRDAISGMLMAFGVLSFVSAIPIGTYYTWTHALTITLLGTLAILAAGILGAVTQPREDLAESPRWPFAAGAAGALLLIVSLFLDIAVPTSASPKTLGLGKLIDMEYPVWLGILCAGIVAGGATALAYRSKRQRVLAAGLLVAVGVQSGLHFAGLLFQVGKFDKNLEHSWRFGGLVGLLACALLLVAGGAILRPRGLIHRA